MRVRTGMWVAVALGAVIAAGCGSTAAEDQREPEGTAEVTIVGKDNVFEPETVEIKAGREYEFVFKNQGTTVHNLIVQAKDKTGQDFATDIVVNANQEGEFKIKIDQEGTYTMQCTYHPEMKGELRVVR